MTSRKGTTAEEPDWVHSYVESPDRQRKLHRRTLWVVVCAQIFGGAGLAAGVTVGALLAQEMLGSESFGGVPSALFTLGSAAAAFLIGQLSQRFGRRIGLAAGALAGALGAVGVVLAAMASNIVLLFASLLIYGAGTAANLQTRYAGTDLAEPGERAKAASIALMATTCGAVAGPNLVNVMGTAAKGIGIPPLAGPFLLSAMAFSLAGIILLLFLRPDPYLVARAIARAKQVKQGRAAGNEQQPRMGGNRKVVLGAAVMALTQMVMVAIMTMTPVHMKHHGHGLGDVGLVIGIHVAAMYLPSLATGVLVDRFGRTVMAYAAGVTLLAAGLVAALAPADSTPLLIAALALLGLGWNFGLISGTAIIVDATTAETRAKTQGTVDVLIAISGASGGALSGLIMANSSYAVLAMAGGFVSLLLIPVVIWSRRRRAARHSQSSTPSV
ncbi:MFS transporter [Paenibacillus sp. GCM10027626]|uniref:MFS transporter n=1 Tax=Paenibacillus sp. GCM10027626 TaxID=3273411 RepID=UPI003635842E